MAQSTGQLSPFRSPKKEVTRYGPIKSAEPRFGTEERFQWQKSQNSSDVMYDVPVMNTSKSITFGGARRKGMDETDPDAKKRSTGPGSYDFRHSFDHLSEYSVHQANRFGCAPRQSMAIKTPSPGAVYNTEKLYWNGPEKGQAISFPRSGRGALYGASLGANADMFIPKPEIGPAITIAKRTKLKQLGADAPGAVYDYHVSKAASNSVTVYVTINDTCSRYNHAFRICTLFYSLYV